MTRSDVSEYTRTPVGTLNYWASIGEGPEYMRVGRKTLYRKSKVDQWLDAKAVQIVRRTG
jgi:hypothetical protein